MPGNEEERVKGHCPQCGAGINATVQGEFKHHMEEDEYPVWWDDHHRILQCSGCETVYFQTASYFSEDDPSLPKLTHWPSPISHPEPVWLDEVADRTLRILLTEAYSAFNSNLRSLAAVGMRAVFDRTAELLGVEPTLSFASKLEGLVDKGFAGATEKSALEALTEAGNAAIHRGWRPSKEQLGTMIKIMEGFVYRNTLMIEAAAKLKGDVPPKPSRKGA